MSKIHHIKIERKYADRVIDGSKTFEVRKNDRDYQAGDSVFMNVIEEEHDPKLPRRICINSEKQSIQAKIAYVSPFGCNQNFVVFSLIDVEYRRGDDAWEKVEYDPD